MRLVICAAIGAFCLFNPFVPLTCAQTGSASSPADVTVSENNVKEVTAVISGPAEIPVGRRLVLDASASSGLGTETTYKWFVGNGNQPVSQSVDMLYTPTEKGTVEVRLVITTQLSGEEIIAEVSRTVVAYDRKIVLIAGPTVPEEKLQRHRESAFELGIYLVILKPQESSLPLGIEQSLIKLIQDNNLIFTDAESIIIWTDDVTGLYALVQGFEGDIERLEALKNQSIVLIASRGLNTLQRTARGPFTILTPRQIIVTRKEAINPLMSTSNTDDFIAEIQKNDIDFMVVDQSSTALRPWNLLSSLINYMITHGISSQIVILLLILPIIATILAFLKQIVGITTYGLYTPSILALSFIALGWKVGLIFLLFILIIGYATRTLMQRWRLLYIPKVAILLTAVSFTLLLLLSLAASQNILFGKDTIFILLIMSTLAETLLNVRAEEGWYSALLGMGETIVAALFCVVIVQWTVLQSLILAYPELVLLTILINALLGRFTGLRLVEYFRFRELFEHLQE